jgi:allantoate deiminase
MSVLAARVSGRVSGPVSGGVSTERIAAWIDRFAALTEPGPGVTRLAYTALERRAHALAAEELAALGARVHTDAAGNTIGELPATVEEPGAAIGTGSHLDSVPEGGRFDGIAGVVAALEAARVAAELPRRRPWRFVVFAGEEGARFGQACNGSRMVAGTTTAADLHTLRDAAGVTLHEAMLEVGLDPAGVADARWVREDWHAFLELHIEQGAVLESKGLPIGVVDTISGSTRLGVRVRGQASHTGGTPMHLRKDALVTASRCVLEGDRLALDPRHRGTRVTVGRMTVLPGSITTIPGRVDFTVDVRDVDGDRQRRTAEELAAAYARIGAEAGTEVEVEILGDTSPVVLPTWLVDHVVGTARELGLGYRVLPSGASHDSQQIGHVLPVGMVFVPSRDGVSHVPEEFTETADLAAGTRLLVEALAGLDAS